MFGINACDVNAIAVMSDVVDDCICQRTVIVTHLVIPLLEFIPGAVRSYPFALNLLVSIEAILLMLTLYGKSKILLPVAERPCILSLIQ